MRGKELMNPNSLKYKIKSNLSNLSIKRLEELNDFIEFMIQKEKKSKKTVKMKGIWKGIGFEKIIDLESEIRKARKESENNLGCRVKKWNV